MPKADATELAPKKIGYKPPAWRRYAGGSFFVPAALYFSLANECVLLKTI
jgi:hypothetical protein